MCLDRGSRRGRRQVLGHVVVNELALVVEGRRVVAPAVEKVAIYRPIRRQLIAGAAHESIGSNTGHEHDARPRAELGSQVAQHARQLLVLLASGQMSKECCIEVDRGIRLIDRDAIIRIERRCVDDAEYQLIMRDRVVRGLGYVTTTSPGPTSVRSLPTTTLPVPCMTT